MYEFLRKNIKLIFLGIAILFTLNILFTSQNLGMAFFHQLLVTWCLVAYVYSKTFRLVAGIFTLGLTNKIYFNIITLFKLNESIKVKKEE